MRAFEYSRPSTLDDAVRLLAAAGADGAVLAGGTDLLSLMKDGAVAPSRLVSLGGVSGLDTLTHVPGQGLRLGATLTIAGLLDSASVRQEYPALTQAAEAIGSPQIRNLGTVAGELCQRPRCWYFRHGIGLLARLDDRSMVPAGDNRYHAILGNDGGTYFVSPSSLAPPLIALGASVKIAGPDGGRDVPLQELFRIPAAESEREHDLAPGEIVTEIVVPPAAGGNATYEVRHRQSLDWPLAAAAAAVEMEGDVIKSARVVLGHVAPIPWPAPQAEAVLRGKPAMARAAEAAGQAAVQEARALSDNQYKVRLAGVAIKRAVLLATGEGWD